MTDNSFINFFLELFNFLKFTPGDIFYHLPKEAKTVADLRIAGVLLSIAFIVTGLINVITGIVNFLDSNDRSDSKITPFLIFIGIISNLVYTYIIIYPVILFNFNTIGGYILLMILMWAIMAYLKFDSNERRDLVSTFNVAGALAKFNDDLIDHKRLMSRYKKNYDNIKNYDIGGIF